MPSPSRPRAPCPSPRGSTSVVADHERRLEDRGRRGDDEPTRAADDRARHDHGVDERDGAQQALAMLREKPPAPRPALTRLKSRSPRTSCPPSRGRSRDRERRREAARKYMDEQNVAAVTRQPNALTSDRPAVSRNAAPPPGPPAAPQRSGPRRPPPQLRELRLERADLLLARRDARARSPASRPAAPAPRAARQRRGGARPRRAEQARHRQEAAHRG